MPPRASVIVNIPRAADALAGGRPGQVVVAAPAWLAGPDAVPSVS
jgi:hypothetical protein